MPGARQSRGYTRIWHDGEEERAHRMAYRLYVGPIPPGMMVCHRCDNPPCCNPSHLFLGTAQDNMADALIKGRKARGESQGSAKATSADVLRMRGLFAEGVRQFELCALFRLHKATVNKIVHRRAWKHL